VSVVVLDFSWSYFGNIVRNFAVDVNGVLSWAPYYGCEDNQCLYYTSSTNSISIGYDINRTNSLRYSGYKVQWTDERDNVGGSGVVRILFLAPTSTVGAKAKPSTVVSIYQDGSIRMTYKTTVAINSDSSLLLENIVSAGSSSVSPFIGLWGAHAGKNYLYPGIASFPTLSNSQLQFASSSTSRFHVSNASSENSSNSAVSPDTTQVLSFCPFELSVCAPSSCVSPGALQATIESASFMAEHEGVIGSESSSVIAPLQSLPSFFDTSSTAAKVYIFDCANTAFGSAYIDSCGVCSGGTTHRTPISSTGAAKGFCTAVDFDGDDNGSGTLTIITHAIILLLVICCLTSLTSAATCSIRRMLLRRQTEQFLLENGLTLQQMMLNVNGELNQVGRILSMRSSPLTEFERNALGEVVFTPEFANSLMRKEVHLVKSSALTATVASPPTNSSNDLSANALDCPICLVEFAEGDIVRHLPDPPCGHVFHRDCVDHWFRQSSQCPLCKRSLRSVLTDTYDEEEHRRRQLQQPQVQQAAESREVVSPRQPSPTLVVSTTANAYAPLTQQVATHPSRHEQYDENTDLTSISLQ
jgi:hypothetical protein